MTLRNTGDLELYILGKNKPTGYKVILIKWVDSENRVFTRNMLAKRGEILEHLRKSEGKAYLLNAKIHKNNNIYIQKFGDKSVIIKSLAIKLREIFEERYGTETDLAGYCIQASELLQAIYKVYGIQSKTVEGWCEYDDEYYGQDRPYDEHTWLEIPLNNQNKLEQPLYVDITADQFNNGMDIENQFSSIIIRKGLPHGMCYREPDIYE